MATTMKRRAFLVSVPALGATTWTRAQSAKRTIPVRALNHMTLNVSNPKHSVEFYQGLFGMPIQTRQHGPLLQIGSRPQFLAFGTVGPNAKAGITHFCMTLDGFNVDDTLNTLSAYGITKSESAAAIAGLSGGPMRVRVRMRGAEEGGAKEGTPELYMGDPDGIVIQLQDTKYCGVAGPLGEVCLSTPEPAPRRGLIAVRGLNHFTLNVSDQQRSTTFYRELFGMRIQTYQGTTPMLAVGSGPGFVVLSGGATPGIGHVCMTVNHFNPEQILKTLAKFGVKPRGNVSGVTPPLSSYIRTENRGDAKEGTPQLYFTDPDGILIQLQDASYCGGSGYLGNLCA